MRGLKLIGKGAFTKAYLDTNNNVILHSIDPIKECMAMGWFPDSPLFPEIKTTGDNEVYIMKYYPRVSSLKQNLKPAQWLIYQQLRKLTCTRTKNRYDLSYNWYIAFESLENKELAETMCKAIDACGNYGSDIDFEISPRNVATDDGNLILLDCFFSLSKLYSTRK